MALEVDNVLKPMVGLQPGMNGTGYDAVLERVAKRKNARRHLMRLKVRGVVSWRVWGVTSWHVAPGVLHAWWSPRDLSVVRLVHGAMCTQGFLSGLTDTTRFGMKELHKLMHEFSEHAGKDGELTKPQFVQIMQTVFPMFAQRSSNGMVAKSDGVDFDSLFEAFDVDNSGKLDFREFTIGMSKLTKGTVIDKIGLLFACYDQDGNGSLTHQEILQFVSKSTDEMVENVDFAAQVVKQLDVDGDGQVTQQEFTQALLKEPFLLHCMARSIIPQLGWIRKVTQDIETMAEHLTLDKLREVYQRCVADKTHDSGLSRPQFRRFMFEVRTVWYSTHVVSRKECLQLLFLGQEFGCSPEAMPLVNKVFEAFDRDGSGLVSFKEMMSGLGQVLTGSTSNRADFYFNL